VEVEPGRGDTPPGALPPTWLPNARDVFDVLLRNGDLTRGGIAELTGLSRMTASAVIEELIRRGFVAQAGTTPASRGGPNARTYGLVSTAAYAVGVAAYLDRIAVSAATITGDIVASVSAPAASGDKNVTLILQLIRDCLHEAGAAVERLHRVVVGTQGVVDPSEQEHLLFVTNVRSWQSQLTERLRAALGCPVVFENDVNLAAFAESQVRAGAGGDDLVFAWIDDGVALGLIVDGRVLRGHNGWAGEIGFVPAAVIGATQTEVGATGRQLTSVQNAASVLGLGALVEQYGVPRGDLLAALRAGFPTVSNRTTLYDEIAHRIVLALGPPILMLDPDIVVLAGSIPAAGGQRLLDALAPHLARLGGVPTNLQSTQVVDDPIVRGAVQLAVEDARDALFVPATARRWER
jgi:predicted NBD/HSP70 family sugar kinase